MYQAESVRGVISSKQRLLPLLKRFSGTPVFALGLTSLFTDISSEMVSSILPLYIVFTLHSSPMIFGAIDGIYQGASVLIRLISGFFSDKLQRHKEIAATGYIFSALNKIGFLINGLNVGSIGGLILLDRIGKGIRTPSRDAIISQTSDSKTLASSFGVHRTMDTFGAMLGPLLAAFILAQFPAGYSIIFSASAAFAFVGVAIILFFVPSIKNIKSKSISLLSINGLFNSEKFKTIFLSSTLLSLVTISDSFIYLSLQKLFNLSHSLFPLLYIAVALVFIFLAIPIGKLADKIGRFKVFLAGYMLLFLSYLMLLTPISQVFIISLTLLFLGLYYASTDGVLSAMVSKITPQQTRATGLSIVTTGSGIGKIVSSILFGYLWTVYNLTVAIFVFAILFLVVFLLVSKQLKRLYVQAKN